jgi:hypothetical protein
VDDPVNSPNTSIMRSMLLIVSLIVAATAGCASATPRRVDAPSPTLADRTRAADPDGELPKRPRVPRWVAPPPAYGNRVVLLTPSEEVPEG